MKSLHIVLENNSQRLRSYTRAHSQSRYCVNILKQGFPFGRKKEKTVAPEADTCRPAPLSGVTPSYVKVWWDAAICFKMATEPLQVISRAADVARGSKALHQCA
jgi:hypothetical protein